MACWFDVLTCCFYDATILDWGVENKNLIAYCIVFSFRNEVSQDSEWNSYGTLDTIFIHVRVFILEAVACLAEISFEAHLLVT